MRIEKFGLAELIKTVVCPLLFARGAGATLELGWHELLGIGEMAG